MVIFWWVLAVLFLLLAIISYIFGRPIHTALKRWEGMGEAILDKDPTKPAISLSTLVYKSFKLMSITNLVGFILASFAALISASS